MQTWRIKKLVVDALEDLKGRDITVLDVRKNTDFTDFMVLCTGTSNRHVKSLANNVVKAAEEKDLPVIGVEGEQEGEWILVDLADIVVHVMLQQARDFYNLEHLWSALSKHRKSSESSISKKSSTARKKTLKKLPG